MGDSIRDALRVHRRSGDGQPGPALAGRTAPDRLRRRGPRRKRPQSEGPAAREHAASCGERGPGTCDRGASVERGAPPGGRRGAGGADPPLEHGRHAHFRESESRQLPRAHARGARGCAVVGSRGDCGGGRSGRGAARRLPPDSRPAAQSFGRGRPGRMVLVDAAPPVRRGGADHRGPGCRPRRHGAQAGAGRAAGTGGALPAPRRSGLRGDRRHLRRDGHRRQPTARPDAGMRDERAARHGGTEPGRPRVPGDGCGAHAPGQRGALRAPRPGSGRTCPSRRGPGSHDQRRRTSGAHLCHSRRDGSEAGPAGACEQPGVPRHHLHWSRPRRLGRGRLGARRPERRGLQPRLGGTRRRGGERCPGASPRRPRESASCGAGGRGGGCDAALCRREAPDSRGGRRRAPVRRRGGLPAAAESSPGTGWPGLPGDRDHDRGDGAAARGAHSTSGPTAHGRGPAHRAARELGGGPRPRAPSGLRPGVAHRRGASGLASAGLVEPGAGPGPGSPRGSGQGAGRAEGARDGGRFWRPRVPRGPTERRRGDPRRPRRDRERFRGSARYGQWGRFRTSPNGGAPRRPRSGRGRSWSESTR